MLQVSGLVPARFLTLVSHLVLSLTVLMAREENVLACLPIEHTQLEFDRRDTELATGLGVAIGLMAIEMVRSNVTHSFFSSFSYTFNLLFLKIDLAYIEEIGKKL